MHGGFAVQAKTLVREYANRRELILQLILRDFRLRYVGSAFGFLWAFLQPFALMAILYTVFRYGLKSAAAPTAHNIPYITWFFSAMIAWNFFQECLTTVCPVYTEYSFLVKKVNFRLAILPFVKIMSSLIVHLVFIVLVIAITLLNGASLSWHLLQLAYYIFAMMYLLLGLAWIIASVQVFFRDVSQVVAIFTQIGFWGTPIVWSLDALPENFRIFVKLNPMYYLIEGYRMSLVYGQPIWETELWQHLYFWGVSTGCFIAGVLVYKKLKPYFADVL